MLVSLLGQDHRLPGVPHVLVHLKDATVDIICLLEVVLVIPNVDEL